MKRGQRVFILRGKETSKERGPSEKKGGEGSFQRFCFEEELTKRGGGGACGEGLWWEVL